MGKPQLVWTGKVFGSASITQVLSKRSDASIQESWKAQGKVSCTILCTSCSPIQPEQKTQTLSSYVDFWHQHLWSCSLWPLLKIRKYWGQSCLVTKHRVSLKDLLQLYRFQVWFGWLAGWLALLCVELVSRLCGRNHDHHSVIALVLMILHAHWIEHFDQLIFTKISPISWWRLDCQCSGFNNIFVKIWNRNILTNPLKCLQIVVKVFSLAACRSGLICFQEWASVHLWGSGYLNIWIPHTPISESEYMGFVWRYLLLNCRFVRILYVISPRELTSVFSCKLPYFSQSCGLTLLTWAQASCLQRWKCVLLSAQEKRSPQNPRPTLVYQHLP